jgi:hypothetical protein
MGSGQCVGLKVHRPEENIAIPGQVEGIFGSARLLGTKKEFG